MVTFKDGTIALLTRNSQFKGATVEFGVGAIGFRGARFEFNGGILSQSQNGLQRDRQFI